MENAKVTAHAVGDVDGAADTAPCMVAPATGPNAQLVAAKLNTFEAPYINTATGSVPIVWERAKGAIITDIEGNRYIDLAASFGAAAIGHCHDKVVAALHKQVEQLLVALGDLHPHPLRPKLAERLSRFVPIDDAMVYFAMTGAEAIEIAVKTAILATGRSDILVFDPAYHGCTLGALSASSRQSFREPFQQHLSRAMHRLPYGCADNLLADTLASKPFAAVLVEPIVGREGVLFPPQGWLRTLEQLCAATGSLFIADEVLTGFGRTGSWFAFQNEGVTPDIICCGKALGGGVPIAAVVARSEIMNAWKDPGSCIHTTTFLANPVGCAAALAALEVMEEEDLPERANQIGRVLEVFFKALKDEKEEKLKAHGATICDVKGRGALWRVQTDPPFLGKKWARIALSKGVLVLASSGMLRISPPLLISDRILEHATEILSASLDEAIEGLEKVEAQEC